MEHESEELVDLFFTKPGDKSGTDTSKLIKTFF